MDSNSMERLGLGSGTLPNEFRGVGNKALANWIEFI